MQTTMKAITGYPMPTWPSTGNQLPCTRLWPGVPSLANAAACAVRLPALSVSWVPTATLLLT